MSETSVLDSVAPPPKGPSADEPRPLGPEISHLDPLSGRADGEQVPGAPPTDIPAEISMNADDPSNVDAIAKIRAEFAAGHLKPREAGREVLKYAKHHDVALPPELRSQVKHMGHDRVRDKKWFKPVMIGSAAIIALLGMFIKRAASEGKGRR